MRNEFPAKVCAQAFERANGKCERCTAKLYVGKFAFDHRIPDAMGGRPALDNCDVLCVACHSIKTRTRDVPEIAKVKRVKAKLYGPRKRSTFAGSRDSKWRKKLNGQVVERT